MRGQVPVDRITDTELVSVAPLAVLEPYQPVMRLLKLCTFQPS